VLTPISRFHSYQAYFTPHALLITFPPFFSPRVADLQSTPAAPPSHSPTLQDATVRASAEAAGAAIVSKLNPAAIRLILPTLLETMSDNKAKWQSKMGAVSHLATLALAAPEELSACLPDIVPNVTSCMTDIKVELRDASTAALVACCACGKTFCMVCTSFHPLFKPTLSYPNLPQALINHEILTFPTFTPFLNNNCSWQQGCRAVHPQPRPLHRPARRSP
jgi:hypothetical protein